MEVEGHEVGDAGVDGLELALVLEGLVHRHDGAWCQVGHDKDDVDAGRADGGGHQLGDGARCVAEMHMHIGRGGQDVFVLEGHFGGGRWGVVEMGEGFRGLAVKTVAVFEGFSRDGQQTRYFRKLGTKYREKMLAKCLG